MKTFTVVAIPLLLLGEGCADLHQVDAERPDSWISKAQDKLGNHRVTVSMTDGMDLEGKLIQLNADSLSVLNEKDSSATIIPLTAVLMIRSSRNVLAPIGGFLGGAAAGALIGGKLAAESVKPQNGPTIFSPRLFAGIKGGIYGGCIGAIVGGMIVSGLTAADDYRLISKPQENNQGHLRSTQSDTLLLKQGLSPVPLPRASRSLPAQLLR